MFMAGAGFLFLMKRFASARVIRWTGIGLGAYMLTQTTLDRLHLWIIEGYPVAATLQLHLCGLSMILVAILLIGRYYPIFELTYFWGFAGAGMALLTPDLGQGFPSIRFVLFFFDHSLIIIGVVFMMVLYGYRPTVSSLVKTMVITQIYVILIFPLNYLLDSNYLFLRHKPAGSSLVDFFGPWPWYIIGMELVGVVLLLALYSPYFVYDRFKRDAK